MTATTAPYRSELRPAPGGFAQLLHAEWTKFRTVRGWMIAVFASTLLVVLFAWIATRGRQTEYCSSTTPGVRCQLRLGHPPVPVGPDGEAVTDTYYFVHRTLAGAGSITARVTGLGGVGGPVQPWAKAGLIVTDSTSPGSPYAAVMLTGGHGVRMQANYTHDTGTSSTSSAGSPLWLRLTRFGSTLTGYESADGVDWTEIGTARLTGLSEAVQSGLFVTSPQTAQLTQVGLRFAADSVSEASAATARFDRLTLQGNWQGGGWRGENVGANSAVNTVASVGLHRSSRGFNVSGSGDIAPAIGVEAGYTAQLPLAGVFAGLIVLIVVATMFITTEYRRGLIHTTLAASPRRGRVLAAKALVIAWVAFIAGAAAAAAAIPVGEHLLRANGNYVYPTSTLTLLRVILGTGALGAVVAVLAVAMGTALRRSAGAVCAVIVLIVLPYFLATASALTVGASQWLLRVTPAAAFAVQQTLPRYHQVSYPYAPSQGFYPLSPAAGFAVLCAYALVALAFAGYRLRTRDA